MATVKCYRNANYRAAMTTSIVKATRALAEASLQSSQGIAGLQCKWKWHAALGLWQAATCLKSAFGCRACSHSCLVALSLHTVLPSPARASPHNRPSWAAMQGGPG